VSTSASSQEVLGHSTYAVTADTYAHIAVAQQREAAARLGEADNPMAIRVATPAQLGRCFGGSEHSLTRHNGGGSKQARTADPFLVREVLYQLSYAPGSLPHVRSGQD
jgi:hypothetical protein